MSKSFSQGEKYPAAVERRMVEWELSKSTEEKNAKQAHLDSGVKIDYIAISRELGSGGDEVARILSELMQWNFYDKDILDYMSEDMNVRKSVLESVDERTMGVFEDWLVPFFTSKSNEHVEQLSYYRHLGKILLVIAKKERAIIIGRGAGQVLPRDNGLSVRVTAPLTVRCDRYARENNISVEEAEVIIKKADKNQSKFIKDFARKDISDSRLYDIVCNTEKLAPKSVAKIIWRALDERVVSRHEYAKAESKDIAAIVEKQFRQWEQVRDDQQAEKKHAQLAGGAHIDYITISREVGAGGGEVSRMLSDKIKWQVYDNEILNYMAKNMKVHVKMLTSVDERTISWIGERLLPLFRKPVEQVRKMRYYHHLGEVLYVIAEHGEAIIVGRGASQILPREKGLSVRVIAPVKHRCKRYARVNDISLEEATAVVKKADREHSRFLKDFLNKDIDDFQYYDIICNTEKLTPTSVAKLVWRAFDQRIVSDLESYTHRD